LSGPDKLLHLTIPVDEPNRRYHVVIVLDPAPEPKDPAAKESNSWLEGYFENVFGSIEDETSVRHP